MTPETSPIQRIWLALTIDAVQGYICNMYLAQKAVTNAVEHDDQLTDECDMGPECGKP